MAINNDSVVLPDGDAIGDTIGQARESIKRIEDATDRINKIVNSAPHDMRQHQRRQDDAQDMSIRFITFVLVCVIAVLGLFGVLFFNITNATERQIVELKKQVSAIETTVKEIKPSSRNSRK